MSGQAVNLLHMRRLDAALRAFALGGQTAILRYGQGSPSIPPVYDEPVPFILTPTVTGATWNPTTATALQTALTNSARGDLIILNAGTTYVGNFLLPVKTGDSSNGWVTLRSSAYGSFVDDTRATSADVANMPRIRTANTAAALRTEFNSTTASKGWAFEGIEVDLDPAWTSTLNFGIITLGGNQPTLGQTATDFFFHHCYIHGGTNTPTSRGIACNAYRVHVKDCTIDECHAKGSDSQAIAMWNTPGMLFVENSYLAGAGENFICGGSDSQNAGMIPKDLHFDRCHIKTPIAWKTIWTKKNLFEIKCADRVLLENSVLDGSWGDGQVGTGVALKSSNQNGAATWSYTANVTLRNVKMINVAQPFNFAGHANVNAVAQQLNRVSLDNVLVEDVNIGQYNGDPRFMLYLSQAHDITVRHSTMLNGGGTQTTFMTVANAGIANVTVDRCIFTRGNYGLLGDGGLVGQCGMNLITGVHDFTNNVVIGVSNGTASCPYPTGTQFVASQAIAEAIPDRGVNYAVLNAAIAGVV